MLRIAPLFNLILLFFLFLLLLTTCYDFNNPWDPEADNYQGQGNGSGSNGTVTLEASQDTTINSGAPSMNYGSCYELNTNRSGASDLGDWRLLVRFDLSGIPAGVTIDSAELRLTKLSGDNGGADFNIHRATSAWYEGSGSCSGSTDTANWNQRLESTSWATPGGDYTPTPLAAVHVSVNGVYSWSGIDLTTVVSNWYQGTMSNNGFIGGSPQSGTADLIFASREAATMADRPKLVVNYSTSP